MARKILLPVLILLLLLANLVWAMFWLAAKQQIAVQGEEIRGLTTQVANLRSAHQQLEKKLSEAKKAVFLPLEKNPARQKELKEETESLRGLKFKTDVPINVMSREELAALLETKVAEETDSDYFKNIQMLYDRLGLLPPKYDVEKQIKDLYQEQIVGLFDPETKKMYLVGDTGSTSESEKEIVLVHELTHALTDQYYPEVNELQKRLSDQNEDDASMALQALMEGDATYMMTLHMLRDPLGMLIVGTTSAFSGMLGDMEKFEQAPEILKQSMLFPYEQGLAFAQYYHLQGGNASLDSLYQNPPLSSEQIMHPEKYNHDFPRRIRIDMTDLKPAPSEKMSFTFGEMETRQMLLEYIGESDAVDASMGWDGGIVSLIEQNNSHALVLAYTWDSEEEKKEFSRIYTETYLPARFKELKTDGAKIFTTGSSRTILLEDSGNLSLVIIDADSRVAAEEIAAKFKITETDMLSLP